MALLQEVPVNQICRNRRLQRVTRPQIAARELTIEEVVADPIVCDLMRADQVDPHALEALMRSVSARSRDVACK